MKGFYIYEVESRIGTVVDCLELGDIDNIFTQEFAPGTITEEVKMHALVSKGTKSKCSKDDTYDFEIGALIALMKMCGLEKSAKAYAEIFDDTAYGDTLIERDKLKNKLQETTDCLNDLSKRYDVVVSYCDSLREANKGLQEEVKCLKGESENHWKNYQRKIQKKQDRINELEAQVTASEDDKQKNIEYYEKEIKNLNYRLTCKDISLEAKDKKTSIYEKRMLALEAENEKLKLDCEKLQHGYNDMILCGGRQNGKQFTFLVDLFKNIDQKKVDAAYKEAYNTTLPVWQKEFLIQAYEIRKESKEKTELPSIFKDDPHSKREQMWDDILKEGRTPVWVKREDIHDFLEECQMMGIKWSSGKLPLETMPFHMTDGYESAYFFVHTSLDISKSKKGAVGTIKKFRHVMTWWATACPEEVEAAIHYIRPMRWDLFEKSRIAVKVSKENYAEFCSRIFSHFDTVRMSAFNHDCKFGYFVFNKDTNYVERILASDNGDAKEINRRKVVDWEDVR